MNQENLKLAVIGLGYVGLPLAAEFAKSRQIIGFDIDIKRIQELKKGMDRTKELSKVSLFKLKNLKFTNKIKDIEDCDCYIITVPTPVDKYKRPDLSALLSASSLVGSVLSKENIVIYESTVYPGVTEENCGPILEKISGLSLAKRDISESSDIFYLGYSPERINPGDKSHSLTDVVKITSGSTPKIANIIDQLYASIITAGTFKTSSIRIAEAAKVIENIQRDVNIALINELVIIFERVGIDTEAVLDAAGTKWNFLPFRPGLVGGHCIGVDPYYLTHKAVELGYNPEIIIAGRRINDNMSTYAAGRIIKSILNKNINVLDSSVLILGVTFKENCPDVRNSKVFDMINSLSQYRCRIQIYDPWIKKSLLPRNLQHMFLRKPVINSYDVIVLAVGHDQFKRQGISALRQYGKTKHLFFDLKYTFDFSETDERL